METKKEQVVNSACITRTLIDVYLTEHNVVTGTVTATDDDAVFVLETDEGPITFNIYQIIDANHHHVPGAIRSYGK